jgi:hypothetical protein
MLAEGTVALSDRPTLPAPPARPEAIREAFRCPVYWGFPGCLRSLLPRLGAWRGRSSPQCDSALATALGCSIADLTGQPYLPADRDAADALAALPSIRLALNDFGSMDVPDVTPRPLEVLASSADKANEQCGQAHYSLAGHDVRVFLPNRRPAPSP